MPKNLLGKNWKNPGILSVQKCGSSGSEISEDALLLVSNY